MAQSRSEASQVNARIVYWGTAEAGLSANLHRIYSKLRADNRGELRQIPTRLDPTVSYETLPIELGAVNGVQTRLQLVTVPGGAEHAPTRKQLLDRVDGLVLVVDCQQEHFDENLACVQELRESLEAYGRSLDDLPVVVQYNRPDHTDPGIVEQLHRALALTDVAVFETVASKGNGALQALTTISKRVVRVLRERDAQESPEPPHEPKPHVEATSPETPSAAATPPPTEITGAGAPVAEPTLVTPLDITQDLRSTRPVETHPTPPVAAPDAGSDPAPSDAEARAALPRVETGVEAASPAVPARAIGVMEMAILAEGERVDEGAADTAFEAQTILDQPWDRVPDALKSSGEARIGADLRIVSVGAASRAGDRAVRVPVVLGNAEGESVTLALTIQLEPILDGEET
jgi:signal recognition particle receptor subunit beta